MDPESSEKIQKISDFSKNSIENAQTPPSPGQNLPSFRGLSAFDPDLSPARREAAANPLKLPLTGTVEDAPFDPLRARGTRRDPVKYLLDLVEAEPDADLSPEQRLFLESLRLKAALGAAPFVHAKLSQVNHTGRLQVSHEDALAQLDDTDEET